MNIFPAKLRSIELQNSNLGGVNYDNLNSGNQNHDQTVWSPENNWQQQNYQQYNMGYQPEMNYMNSSADVNNYSHYYGQYGSYGYGIGYGQDCSSY